MCVSVSVCAWVGRQGSRKLFGSPWEKVFLMLPSSMLTRAVEETVPDLWNILFNIRRWPKYSHIKSFKEPDALKMTFPKSMCF